MHSTDIQSATLAELQRLVLDRTPDALVMCSAQDEVLLWSPGAAATFGYDAAQALGRRWFELVVPADRVHEETQLREDAVRQDTGARTVVRRHRDGHLLYVDSRWRAVHDDAGTLRGWVIASRDVTAHTVERDTRLLEERWRDLLEFVPDSIVVANEIGRIVLFNAQSEQMFSAARADMLGRPIETLLPPRYGVAHTEHRARYAQRPQVRRMGAGLALFALRSDGSEFPVEISLSPLSVGERRFTMSAIRDISLQKQAEQLLQEKNAALEVANQAKDRFLATMSHELRTPLNAILGFSGILLMKLPGPLNPEQERQLGLVKKSGEHLLSLINDLLDLAKIQSGAFRLSPERLDLRAPVKDAVAQLQPLADAKKLALDAELPDAALPRDVDRRAFSQVLLNLLNNAIKFTAQGRVAVRLAADADGVRVEVSDTGVGIAEADLPRLFGSFTQVGDPSRRPEGTGLGLHLSARLAQLMGGRITVHSEPGVGSRFTLHLDGP